MSNLISLLSDCKNKIATLFQIDVAGHMYKLILSYFAIRHHAKKTARATFHSVIVAWACKQDYHIHTSTTLAIGLVYNMINAARAAFFYLVIARRCGGAIQQATILSLPPTRSPSNKKM